MTQTNIELPSWLGNYPRTALALGYAKCAHEGQFRKYTGEPYFTHCFDVVMRVHKFYDELGMDAPDDVLAAAALHDTVEDTDVTFQQLTEVFGARITGLVFWLTDVCPKEWGNRATRKRLEAERLAYAPLEAKIIKFHDIASNTESIEEHDPEFAKTYVPEKRRMLDIIGELSWAWVADSVNPDSCYQPVQ